MRVLITGGAGLIGRKLTERLVRDGAVAGRPITELVLFDVVVPNPPADAPFGVQCVSGDIADARAAAALAQHKPDLVFHLAAVVSGEAEADFDKGYAVNLAGTQGLLEGLRAGGNAPRVVFTSSLAAFGAPFPKIVPEDFVRAPQSSYGAQKVIGEILLADYSRKGFVDGVGLLLPTITVRPGKPNRAASSFLSGIIREPLQAEKAICPVGPELKVWIASPRAAIEFLMHAAAIDTAELGARRTLTMPGLSISVGEMVAALQRVAGEDVTRRIRWERDEAIARIVETWPEAFSVARAKALGFSGDSDFDSIIQDFIAHDMVPAGAQR